MGTGFIAFHDESRYCLAGKALHHISKLEIGPAIKDIFSAQGRPVGVIFHIIPNTLQYITSHLFNLSYYESKNSFPLFIFNFIILCFILIVHYLFSKLLFNDTFLALISVLLFSTLTDSYIYLRHALPYDMSLLIFYVALYKIAIYTKNNCLSNKKSLIIGFCSFLGFSVYPGYFVLYFIILFILLFNKLNLDNIFKRLFASIYFLLGGILGLFFFDKISRLVKTSYILNLQALSTTINQGSFEESYIFLFKYLIEVEGLAGLILLIGLLFFFFIINYQIKNKKFEQYSLINLLGIAVIGAFLSYASAGYFLHKVIFNTRLLHQYLIFICIIALYAINIVIAGLIKENIVIALIGMVFIINYIVNIGNYCQLYYPRDILWQIIYENKLINSVKDHKYCDQWPVMPKNNNLLYYDINMKSIPANYEIILTGTPYSYNVYITCRKTKSHKLNSKDNYHWVASKPSFMNFKAYQFDSGASMIERYKMSTMDIKINIFALFAGSGLRAGTR